MKFLFAAFAVLASLPCGSQLQAQESAQSETPSVAVQQLRHVIGSWDVATTFHRQDGTPGRSFDGTYSFEWVMEDKIVKGMSTIPEFGMASGLLFYLRPSTNEIEMVSVGPDGQLWTMTGPQGSETRETPVVEMPDGATLKLRFTRFNVSNDRFESKMESSTDGGETWVQGNHQVFVRRVPQPSAAIEMLRPLAGACWKGVFGEGPAYDVMCVEEMAGGFLKSRHTVLGIKGSYSGETIYFIDPTSGEPRYTYYTSLGAIQQGRIALGEGKVLFEDIRHITREGKELHFKGTGELRPDGTYRATTSAWVDSAWAEPGEVVFVKIDCSGWSEVEQGCAGD